MKDSNSIHQKKTKLERTRLQKIIIDIFSGTVAGINLVLVGHPLDTLKTRLQTQPRINPIYNGLLDCFKKTIEWEGVRGLYKGMTSPLVGQMFFRALLFLSYGEAKRIKTNNGKIKITNKDYFLCGAIAWFFATFAACPIDFLKTQSQIQIIKLKSIKNYSPNFITPYECFKKVMKLNGITGLFQGYSICLIRNILAGSVQLGIFELTRINFSNKLNCEVKNLPIYYSLICGGLGGFFYWHFFYPLDVIKSVIQSDNIEKNQRKHIKIVETTKFLMSEGGIKRFYAGFSPCIIRAIPANSVLLFTSSWISEHL